MGEAIGVKLDTDQLVLTRGRDFKWSFENLDDSTPPQPIPFPDGDLFFELQTRGETNAKQSVTVSGASAGAYKFGFKNAWSTPISFDAVTDNPQNLSGDIKDSLEGISTIGAGNVAVTPSTLYPVWELDLTLNRGANEVQTIEITGNPTGGYFLLSFGSQTTGQIPWNATAAQIQAALEALPAIGTGNVTVASAGTNKFTVTFAGSLALKDVPQLVPTYTHWVNVIFLLRTLTGGTKPAVTVTTTTPGSTPLSQSQVNVINTTLNNLYNTFDDLLGVTVDITVMTNYNMRVKVKATNSFDENGLKTFAVNVTSDLIQNAFNGVASLLNAFDIIHVVFFWEHTFQVEFINALGLQPQPALEPDITDLTSINEGAASVDVTVLDPGKHPLTLWHFDIDGSLAHLKVESEVADKIADRTEWQLVFLPLGEEAGGDPITSGKVQVQAKNAWVKS